jgi:hypothetical protein
MQKQLDPAEGLAMLLVIGGMALLFGLFMLAAVISS